MAASEPSGTDRVSPVRTGLVPKDLWRSSDLEAVHGVTVARAGIRSNHRPST